MSVIPPAPLLDETIVDGQVRHLDDHEQIAEALNAMNAATLPRTPTGALAATDAQGALAEVMARRGMIVNPLDPVYGALGNSNGTAGSGADDTAAIAAALAAAAGGMLYLPADKNFRITGQLNVPSNTVVWMYGGKITCDNAAADKRFIVAGLGVDNAKVLGVRATCLNPTTRGHTAIALMDGATNCTVQDNRIAGAGQYGILVGDDGSHGGAGGHRIIDNYADMSSAKASVAPVGIIAYPKGGAGFAASPGIVVSGNDVRLGTNTPCEAGIKVSIQRGGKIIGNSVTGGSAHTGAQFTGALDFGVGNIGIEVADNQVDNTQYGILGGGTADVVNGLKNTGVNIHDNTLTRITHASAAAGIYVGDSGIVGMLIHHNTMVGGANATYGVYCQPFTNAQDAFFDTDVQGNHITDFAVGVGLLRDPTDGSKKSQRSNVIGNVIRGGTTPIDVYGDDANIDANDVGLCSFYGLGVQGNRAKINNNRINDVNTGNTADVPAIAIVGLKPSVYGNKIANTGTGHAKWGISFNGATGYRHGNNDIDGMETGKYLFQGTNSSAHPAMQDSVQDGTSTVHTLTVAETTIRTRTIERGALGPFGSLKVRATGAIAVAGAAATLRVKYGGTTVVTQSLAAGTAAYDVDVDICYAASVSTVIARTRRNVDATGSISQSAFAADLSAASKVLELTLQLASAVTDTVTVNSWLVEEYA